jgi:hypothetical protein
LTPRNDEVVDVEKDEVVDAEKDEVNDAPFIPEQERPRRRHSDATTQEEHHSFCTSAEHP